VFTDAGIIEARRSHFLSALQRFIAKCNIEKYQKNMEVKVLEMALNGL